MHPAPHLGERPLLDPALGFQEGLSLQAWTDKMTRDDLRKIILDLNHGHCPPDSEPIDLPSLEQLEFIYAIEDGIEFRHPIPDDIAWRSIDDVAKWLEDKGELQGT
jgi:hypothetical protein